MTRITPDKADQKLQLLDVALKDANLVLADFKATIREGKHLLADIEKVVHDRCEEVVADAVADSIANLSTATEKAIKDAESGIFARFDELFKILMGEDKKGQKRRKNDRTIPKLIENLPYCVTHKQPHVPGQVTPTCVFLEGVVT